MHDHGQKVSGSANCIKIKKSFFDSLKKVLKVENLRFIFKKYWCGKYTKGLLFTKHEICVFLYLF